MDEPIFANERWNVRVITGDPLFFYIDGPFDKIDDGLINNLFDWDSYKDPIYLFGDYAGIPEKLKHRKVIKQSSHKKDNSIACFYQVEDCGYKPIDKCKFQISFQGSLQTHPVRLKILDALKQFDSFHFEPTGFWAKIVEKDELRRSYLNSIEDSQFVLCPRGVGLNSIRFFETLRFGRIPVLLADDTKLPLDWLIKYENFVVFVPEAAILDARKHVDEWLSSHNLVLASQQARYISLTLLNNLTDFSLLV
jgi:hypothetical protein